MRICLHLQSHTISGELLVALDNIVFGVQGTEDGRNEKLAEHTSEMYAYAELEIFSRNFMKCFRASWETTFSPNAKNRACFLELCF